MWLATCLLLRRQRLIVHRTPLPTSSDTPTVFMGMLHGEELSAAYASADVFLMPR